MDNAQFIQVKGKRWEIDKICDEVVFRTSESFSSEESHDTNSDTDFYNQWYWVPLSQVEAFKGLVNSKRMKTEEADIEKIIATEFNHPLECPVAQRLAATGLERDLLTFLNQYEQVLKIGEDAPLIWSPQYSDLLTDGQKYFSLPISAKGRKVKGQLHLGMYAQNGERKIVNKMEVTFPGTYIEHHTRDGYNYPNVFHETEHGLLQLVAGSDNDGFFRPKPRAANLYMMVQGSNYIEGMTFHRAHLGSDALNKLLLHLGLEYTSPKK